MDWSSDVCSSDLRRERRPAIGRAEGQLSADPPVGAEVSGPDPVPDHRPVGIAEHYVEPFEPRLVAEKGGALAGYVVRMTLGPPPEPAVLLPARPAAAGTPCRPGGHHGARCGRRRGGRSAI